MFFLIKNFLTIFLFFVMLNSNSLAQDKIAIIDFDKILNESVHGKKIISNINDHKKKHDIKINKEREAINKFRDEIQKQKKLLSDEDLRKKISQLDIQIKEFKTLERKLISEFNKKRNSELELFFQKINPIIKKYIQEQEINIILEKKNIYIANTKNDITEEILKLLN